MRPLFAAFILAIVPSGLLSAQNQETGGPQIHGTVRAKYEYQPQISSGRFEVRNARISLDGKCTPIVSYKAEIDLSDEGSIKMLDAYARLSPLSSTAVTLGQMRVPFTIDAHRSPHQQYFANRSFIAKQVGNIRDVGLTLAWHSDKGLPVQLEGGAFNGSGLTNQKNYWTSDINYSAKVQLSLLRNTRLVLSLQKAKPDQTRIHLYDIGAYWHTQRWHVEAEYLFKHYARNAFADVHAVDVFICHDIPLRRAFRKISLLGRFDYMSNHSDGTSDENGLLSLTDAARKRITGGITLSLSRPFLSDIRLNFEKYIYRHDAPVKVSEQDKIVLEFMTRF